MMKIAIPKQLRSALFDSLAVQIVLAMIAVFVLDSVRCLQMWAFAMVVYWSGCSMILIRRWNAPTKTDIAAIRWGFLILCFVVIPAFSDLIWRILVAICS